MKLIVFDLDGTLVDSRRDIATSVNELLRQMSRPALASETIYGFIGDGVRSLLDRSLGSAPAEEVDRAVPAFRAIYRHRLLETTGPYPGVREALDLLFREHILTILTNKPRPESLAILEGLALLPYFRLVYGGESFPRRKPDPMGVEALLEATGVTRELTLMVGDSRVDYETARNASIAICLVSYGLGAAEIASLDPDYVVDDLRQLIPIVRLHGEQG